MPELDRMVAGLRCRDVLALLDEYVAGELSPARLEQVEGHLRGCDNCARFGGEYGALVERLRDELGSRPAGDVDGARGRLESRIAEFWRTE